MQLLGTPQQAESDTELIVQGIGIVTHNPKATALRRAFRAKSTDDHVSAMFHGSGYSFDVCSTIFGGRKKMEHGPIMPDVVGSFAKVDVRYIRHHPFHLTCGGT